MKSIEQVCKECNYERDAIAKVFEENYDVYEPFLTKGKPIRYDAAMMGLNWAKKHGQMRMYCINNKRFLGFVGIRIKE